MVTLSALSAQLQIDGVGIQTQASTLEPGSLSNSRSFGTSLPSFSSCLLTFILKALIMCYTLFRILGLLLWARQPYRDG